MRSGDVELFFDLMKFLMHVLDFAAQTHPIDGLVLQLRIHGGGFLPHVRILSRNRWCRAVSLQQAFHVRHHAIEVGDLSHQPINGRRMVEFFLTRNRVFFLIISRSHSAKSRQANCQDREKCSKFSHA